MKKPRHTGHAQPLKSALMQERLLRATVDCLYEKGYAGTSTNEVIKRAGVSRGAMLHHYPSKFDLVLAAAAYASERTIAQFRDALSTIDNEAERVTAALDLLWQSFTGPTFYALLELAVASRTDPRLNERLRGVSEQYDRLILEIIQELFPDIAAHAERFEADRMTLYFLLQGTALNRIVQKDDARALRAIRHFLAVRMQTLS